MRVLPRFRRTRRLLYLWLGVAALAAGGVAAMVELLPSGGSIPRSDLQISNVPASIPRLPHAERPTRSDERMALTVASLFVRTAVRRQNLAAAYAVTSPSLREGMSLKQWQKGAIAVVPFPARSADWRLDASYHNDILLGVYLYPLPGANEPPTAFSMELRATGQGRARRWFVSSWAPAGTAAPTGESGHPMVLPTFTPSALSAKWLLIPAVLLALVLFMPIVVLSIAFVARRAGDRQYRRRSQLPDLPPSVHSS